MKSPPTLWCWATRVKRVGKIFPQEKITKRFCLPERTTLISGIMTREQLNQAKVPIIVFDKKLEALRGKTLFPEKLRKANEILAKTGVPTINRNGKVV